GGGAGNPAPSVRWQVRNNHGGDWNDLAGETSTTLSLTKPAVAQSGNQYRAVFTNTCGGTQTAASNAVTLSVTAKPITGSFTAQNKVYDGNTSATVTG